jgi:hypothetical protein
MAVLIDFNLDLDFNLGVKFDVRRFMCAPWWALLAQSGAPDRDARGALDCR